MSQPLRLAVTGFVSSQAGSVASANALFLRELLRQGHEVVFFSKSSFVDPRPIVDDLPGFRFVEVDNVPADRFRRQVEAIPLLGFAAGRADAFTYGRLLIRRMTEVHRERPFDLSLWLGDYALGRVPGLKAVSYAQGPPGTDARSILHHFDEIRALAGAKAAQKWRLLAQIRLSKWGGPALQNSDHLIIGSEISRTTLGQHYGVPRQDVSILPYPIDLEQFQPSKREEAETPELRCLWLGRIIPRKRLDLFLDGAALTLQRGIALRLTIVGGVGFVPGYEQLIRAFPQQDRIRWIPSLPREEVPALLNDHDVLVQPSEEENFGSSAAEAQACGLPIIVGATNGNADYLCARDIHLRDYEPSTLADAFAELSERKHTGTWGDAYPSRKCAEQNFAIETATTRLRQILEAAR